MSITIAQAAVDTRYHGVHTSTLPFRPCHDERVEQVVI